VGLEAVYGDALVLAADVQDEVLAVVDDQVVGAPVHRRKQG